MTLLQTLPLIRSRISCVRNLYKSIRLDNVKDRETEQIYLLILCKIGNVILWYFPSLIRFRSVVYRTVCLLYNFSVVFLQII